MCLNVKILGTADETVNGPALHLGGGFSSAIEWMTHSLLLLPPQGRVNTWEMRNPLVGELLENEDSHMRVAVYKLQKVTEFW